MSGTKRRRSDLQLLNARYRSMRGGYKGCFYCGVAESDTIDHIPPVSRVDDYLAMGLHHLVYIKVACCHECNSLLGASLQPTPIHRFYHLKSLLLEKYSDVLNAAEWTPAEIKQLGAVLRTYIERHAVADSILRKRLDSPGGLAKLLRTFENLTREISEIDDPRPGAAQRRRSDVTAERVRSRIKLAAPPADADDA